MVKTTLIKEMKTFCLRYELGEQNYCLTISISVICDGKTMQTISCTMTQHHQQQKCQLIRLSNNSERWNENILLEIWATKAIYIAQSLEWVSYGMKKAIETFSCFKTQHWQQKLPVNQSSKPHWWLKWRHFVWDMHYQSNNYCSTIVMRSRWDDKSIQTILVPRYNTNSQKYKYIRLSWA